MAFTQITSAGFGLTTGTLVGVAASFSSTVSVGGTLTYEDVTNVDSVGLITARNGIEVTDKGVQVGTGATVDSAAANTLTFLTNGNERLRITSGGDIGVGNVSSPSNNIEIRTDSNDEGVLIKSTGNTSNALDFDANRSGAGNGLASIRGKWNGTTVAQISFLAGSDTTNKDDGVITFGTESAASNGNANAGEKLRIDSSGRLLLGTTTEGQTSADNFTIADSGHCGITIRSGTTSEGAIYFSDGTSGDAEYRGQVFYDHDGDYMRFSTAASERMRIDSSGRLLQGKTATKGSTGENIPTYCTEVASNNPNVLEIANNGTASGSYSALVLSRSDSASVNGHTAVDSGDKIGEVAFIGADGSDRFNTGAAIAAIAQADFSANDCPTDLTFSTNTGSATASERLRINSVGQLLINTTSAANSDTNIEVHDTSTPEFAFGRNDTSITAGNSLGRIRWYGNDSNGTFQECARISATADGTHQTDDKATRLTFWTTEGGSSSPTERLRIHQQGHGEFHSGAITRVVVGDDVSLSGSSQVVTGIPSWATKITIILYRASLSGTANFLVQLRASGSDITSNYNSVSANHTGATINNATDGFIITSTNASHKTSGRMVIERVGTDTRWVSTHMVTQDSGPAPRMGAGDLSSYSGTIDGIKIKDTGSNSFDNGTITVIAEA